MLPRLVLALLAMHAAVAAQVPAVWKNTNPGGGGWFERIAAGPTGLVIACSDLSGAYRSHDRGQTWQALGAVHGLWTTHVSAVAFHHYDAHVLYLGTEDGIYVSTDLGESFTYVLRTGYVETIASAPSDSRVAYAGWHPTWNSNDGQVFKTTDRGVSWMRVDTNLPRGHRILEILVTPDDTNTVYALTGVGRFASGPRSVFRSLDGGVTWATIGAFQDRVVDIAIDRNAPGLLYATTVDSTPGTPGHLLRSSDRGSNWTELARQGGFVWVDRRDSRHLRTIDPEAQYPWDPRQGIWGSSQSGNAGTWSRISSVSSWTAHWSKAYWAYGATSPHGGFGEDHSDPSVLYWVNSQFVFATFDGGKSVFPLFSNELGGAGSGRWQSRGIDNVAVVTLSTSMATPDTLYAGFLDLGIWRSLDRGRSWTSINDVQATGAWAGSGGDTWTIVADPVVAGTLWSAQGDGATSPSALLRSVNFGTSWTRVGSGLPAATLTGLSLDARSPVIARSMFVTADGIVYGSTDGGASWSARSPKIGVRFTHVDATRSDIVYAGGEGGFWRSVSSGANATWNKRGTAVMRGGLHDLPIQGWEGVHAIVTDARVPGQVFAAVHGVAKGLFRSKDHGLTWTQLLADDFVRDVLIAPDDPRHLYVVTSSAVESGGFDPRCRGVLESTDDGVTFAARNDGLIWPMGLRVAALTGPGRDTKLFLGSPGTGIHELVPASLRTPTRALHAAVGGTVAFGLDAGPSEAGSTYLLLASLSGSTPGIEVAPGTVLPLNIDPLFVTSLQLTNTPIFVNSLGSLDNAGRANAGFWAPTSILQWLRGHRLTFAYLTPTHASNAVSIVILP
ncbi:MAG: hypothetical protein H6832_16400 [Planctomycetes bacterium]|nr:hypothetical protein [Planctomycetota bacterium]MCB9892531.1 hypothetical protein [Planctomycetota bacterium]MCB9919985.1 hypothetical protein [Planctomycetota bacterium]